MRQEKGKITFAKGAVIYLGGCNAGTDAFSLTGTPFAQELANKTGTMVIAAVNDQVGIKDESNGNMVYTTAYPEHSEFKIFEKGKQPIGVGPTIDLKTLVDYAKQRTAPELKKLKPIGIL